MIIIIVVTQAYKKRANIHNTKKTHKSQQNAAAWQNRQVNVRKQNTCKKYWQKIINAQKEKHKHSSIVI